MTTPTETLISRASTLFREPLLWVLPEPVAGLRSMRSLSVMHSFKPDVIALQNMGITASQSWPEGPFAAVALALPRQVEWACGLLAEALERLSTGGTLLMAAHNTRGGKRYAALLEEYFTLSFSDSKNHCRLVALERPATLPDIVKIWKNNYTPKPVAGTSLLTLPGTFSCDHVDSGSALLARHLPILSGRVADFGAGWGYLAHHLLQQQSPPAHIDLFEADGNALEMARRNLKEWERRLGFFWHDLLSEPCPHQYDAVVMNPPFHDLRDASAGIGRGFIAAAAKALKPGGQLWMVANRHLPYEEILKTSFSSWRSAGDEGGFKVLTAQR
ncbi:MAG: class I SAM-dependent methyltransferase [Alphaproteobacteria bacterium]|nr:MAG: class I SAM-dependent methyltransferase [Alphaproteobacteria bacterium]